MKKLLTFFLPILLLCAMLPCITVFASAESGTEPTIVVSTVQEANAGDTIKVEVYLKNNPGVISAVVEIEYDESVMELVPYEYYDEEEDETFEYNVERAQGWSSSKCYYGPEGSCLMGFTNGTASKNVTKELFFTATFKIKSDAVSGTYPLTVKYNPNNFFNIDNNLVAFGSQNATITIAPSTPAHTCTPEKVTGQAATCIADGWKDYYQCSDETCGKLYADAETEITDFDAWKAGDGKIPAAHIYGELIEATNPVHTKDTLTAGVAAHYHCACGEYFTEEKVATTLEALTGETPTHTAGTAATCTTAQTCTGCDYVFENEKGHGHTLGFRYDSDGVDTNTHTKYCNDCNQEIEGEKITCADKDNNHKCDVCGTELTTCADNDNNHKCDVCGDKLSDCADNDKNHKCDVCDKTLSDCADNDKNHKCDVCGTELTTCADNDKNHKCDVCGTELSKCYDKTGDNDHKCDICGADNVTKHTGGTATCQAAAVCDECGQSYGEKDASNHTSTEVTYKNVTATTHDEYHKCCDTLKKAEVSHDFDNADHKCVCGAVEQYWFKVDYNGGKVISVNTYLGFGVQTEYNKTPNISGHSINPAREGYTLIGWNTKADGTGEAVNDFDAFVMPGHDVIVYAQWECLHETTKAVDNGNGTHDVICSTPECNGHVVTDNEPHNFDNADHKCVCGKVETFTFTWIKENGDVVYTETVEYGKDALNIPALPYEKPGYTASWSHNGKGITENTTITMVFTENTYRVEVYSANGKTLLETRQHKYTTWTSSNVTNFNGIPGTGTSLEGHGFVGFSLEPNGEKVCSTTIYRISVITDNAVYDAERGVYIVKLYVVIGPLQYSISYWVDGKIYSSDRYEYGAAITPETRIPHKAQDGCSVYTFAGWDKEIPATMPAGNVEIHATFTETKNHTGKPVYTDNKNGTHSAAYDCCNAPYVTNEAHDYVTPNHEDKTYDCVCGTQEEIKLPEVVVTDIKNSLTSNDPNLTFALNFAIKDLANLDEEYLAKVLEIYGNYYTDYVLTISGLTKESVIFNANGNADGYLAGQYDAWSENWVTVPFENVTVKNEESLYIMEYAAKLMGKQGLRFTLAEIAMIVQNFDCGVYFTPEFLAANPNLKVTLELKVFTEDAQGNKENDISVAKNDFNNNVVSGWNNIDGDWYYVINGGLAHGLVRVPYPAQSTGILSDLAYERLAEDIAYAERKGIEFIDADTAWFVFDTNGKLVQTTEIKDGKYIENGMIPWHPGFVQVSGVWYYFVSDAENGGNKPANGEIYVTRNTTAAGYASGDLVTFVNGQVKADLDGIVNGYYYENGKLMAGAGLVEIEDGKYIYVSSNGAVVVDTTYWPTKTNDTGIIPNMYEFDANGILQNPEFKDPNATTGVFSGYYYENGEIVAGKGLIQIGNDVYYVRSNGKVATGKYYVTNVSNYEGDFDIESGAKLFFAEDGKMLPIKNGVVDGYYYVNNHILYGAGLIEDEEGNIYYVRSNGKVAVGEYYVTNTNGMEGFEAGKPYVFGKDGKLTK